MKNGILALPDGFAISRDLTKSAFLAAKKGEAAVVVENPPFFSYKLPPIQLYGVRMILTLYFAQEQVTEIHLYPLWDSPSNSWTQQQLAAAEKAKRQNDQWLAQVLGPPPYEYKWGEIMATLDQKSGYSQIIIRYT